MSKHLFIDTNIYLKFYHFSNDDLIELEKLIVLLDNDELRLYLPEQVRNEFYRNRDNKLADALKTFNQSKLNSSFPQFCKEYNEYSNLKKTIKEYEKEKQELLKKIMESIEGNSLKADKLLTSLFDKADVIKSSKKLVERSKIRYDLGNPPGKNKSYGDALNWESLLEEVENEEDLYFIADDKDYISELNSSKFNTFLDKEWFENKSSFIKFYKTLSDFFKDTFPNIKLASELEKELLLSKLINSRNFYNSRMTLESLAKFESFSSEQAKQYLRASLDNTQIRWISQDEDINEYLYDFVEKNKHQIDKDLLDEFYSTISKPPPF